MSRGVGARESTSFIRRKRCYGKVPNAAFVVDRHDVLVYKSTWADADQHAPCLIGFHEVSKAFCR